MIVFVCHCMLNAGTQSQAFHDSIEREFWEFAAFYRLDMPSVKAAAFEHMRNAVEGFDVKTPRWGLSAESGRLQLGSCRQEGRTGLRPVLSTLLAADLLLIGNPRIMGFA